MLVHPVCGYRSRSDEWTDKWSDADFRARNLVKGLKREPFGGFSEWTVKATRQKLRLDDTLAGQALALRVATSKLLDLFAAADLGAVQIVPVPSSQTVAPGGDYTGARLANAVAALSLDLFAAPILHFDEAQPRAHDGGPRRWQDVFPHLRGSTASIFGPVVLLDDVMTTGGHLSACARYLAERGHEVEHAFVVGRTLWRKPAAMFTIPAEHLEP